MSIGKQIKQFRLRKSVRQEDLAAYLGVTCQAVSKWETESSLPDITLLPRLAVYFGCAIDDLFRVGADEQLERIENALHTHARLDECAFESYRSFLEELTADPSRRVQAHLTLAALYNHRAYADHQSAIMHAQQALHLDPQLREGDAWPALIEAYQGHCGDEWLDNHFSLIAFCMDFLQTHPDSFRALYALIENLLADRRYDEAVPYIDQLAAQPGRAHQAEIYRGDVAQGRGDLSAALAHWNRAVEAHPGVWQAWCDRADRLKKLGRYEEALADYDHCFLMQEKPRISDGLYSRAQLFEQLGRWEEAIAERERIIACLCDEFDQSESECVQEQQREIQRLRAHLQ